MSMAIRSVRGFFFTATAYSCLLTLLEQYLNTLYTPTTTMLLTKTIKRHILHRYNYAEEGTP